MPRWSAAYHARTKRSPSNRCFFVPPGGPVAYYDKRHLFTFAGEDAAYGPGEDRVIVEWRGWRILLQVCYDLRFPVFSRNRNEDRYDAAVYVANWPAARVVRGRVCWSLARLKTNAMLLA